MDYHRVYRDAADNYDRMVEAEDCDGELAAAVAELLPGAGARVADLGAGTGRFTRQLHARGASVVAVDRAPAMLRVARERMTAAVGTAPLWVRADTRRLPLPDASVDGAVAGWSYAHACEWEAPDWRPSVEACLSEMRRIVRPGGACVVVESFGTAVDTPRQERPNIAAFYAWMERDLGMARRVLRTDYLFADVAEAAYVLGGFFGEAMAERVRAAGQARVPEFTGLWSRTV